MTIPRKLHHVWPELDPVPHRTRALIEGLRERHPGWEHRLWTPAELDALPMRNRGLYDLAERAAPNDWIRWRADIARLEVVNHEGGIYVDTDTESVRALDPLLTEHGDCWWAESPNREGHVTQAVFGATARHPFLRHLLQRIVKSAHEHMGQRIHHMVGTKFVDREFHAVGEGLGVRMLPWRWFAGRSIAAREKGVAADLTEAYVGHRYDNTAKHRAAAPQIAAFRAAADVLNGVGVEWWLCSGVLLGHIRDGAWIPWDMDVDVGIWPEDVETVRAAFVRAGWPFKRDRESQMWPVHGGRGVKGGTKIDVHAHYRDGDVVFKLHGKGEKIRMNYSAALFEDMQPSVYYLRRTLLPSPPERYLEEQYGPDWMVPRREWRWDESPVNIVRL